MSSWKEKLKAKLYRRMMIQLSDIAWMVTAGVIGFFLETTMNFLEIVTFPSAWWFWLKVIGIYATALGYTSFLCNRSWSGFVLGALTGLIYEWVNAYYFAFNFFFPWT